jgi:hypothetical protein
MKKLAFVVLMALVLAVPAYAQLGDTDNSSFVIQNLGTADASVTVTFYSDTGVATVPNPILPGPGGVCGDANDIANPFTLAPQAKQEINVSFVCGLADGRYSVVVESTEPTAVIANLIGESSGAGGNPWYNGSYSGFDAGATTVYFPSTQYAFYGWNSLISIQNVTSAAISADVTIYNAAGASVGTKNYPTIPAFSSVHLDLEVEGAGLSLPASLNGSAKVVCSGACAATDNQTAAGAGLTQSYGAFLGGEMTLYAPSLYNNYYSWGGSLKVQNIGTTATTIGVTYLYSGGTCTPPPELIQPGQALYHYLPGDWAGFGCSAAAVKDKIIAAVVTSDVEDVVAVVNAANPVQQAQTYSAFGEGANTVGLPVIMNQYYGWDTAFVCQNLDTTEATVTYSYSGGVGCPAGAIYPGCSFTLAAGEAKSVYQPNDLDATTGLYAVTVTSTGGQVACIANETLGANQSGTQGDWSMSYNGFGQ